LCEATLRCIENIVKKAHSNSICKNNDKLQKPNVHCWLNYWRQCKNASVFYLLGTIPDLLDLKIFMTWAWCVGNIW